MNTVDKLNNALGYLTAMSFDKPELSSDLVEPLNALSEAISEVENLSLSGVVLQSEQLCDNPHCEDGIVDRDMYGHPIYCQVCDKHNWIQRIV